MKKNYPLWLICLFIVYSVLCVFILLNHFSDVWAPIFRFAS